MTLDVTLFSNGVGLVMIGWIAGMCVASVMSVLRGV